jgi:hypothetical protein
MVFTLSNASSSEQDKTSEGLAVYPTGALAHLLADPGSPSSHFSAIPSTSHISEILDFPHDSTAGETNTQPSTALMLQPSLAQEVRF